MPGVFESFALTWRRLCMNRKFIVPIVAVVTAGFIVPVIGCGGEVKAEVKTPPVPTVEVVAPPPPPVPVVVAPPPPPPPPPPAPPPPPVATGKIKLHGRRVVIPGELEFDTGKATLKQNPKTKMLLGELVAFFQANPQVTKLEVQGHTDNVGNEDFNVKLSQDRADSVAAGLKAAGVDAGRIVTKGFGSSVDYKDHGKDIPNDSDKHRAMNRRVEFHVLQLGGQDWAAPPEDAAPAATK
jgi:outer membrane protein OmpA-like peptidoglycan-associated protein